MPIDTRVRQNSNKRIEMLLHNFSFGLQNNT